jgi:hypothetical protein
VHAEDLLCHNSRDREGIECIHKGLPDLDIASSLAFVIETVYARDVGTLVVAAEEEEVLGELELVTK